MYNETYKIPENVLIGMLQSEIQELEDLKAKLIAEKEEMKQAYDSVMALTEEGKRKVREALYSEFYVSQLKAQNDNLIEKNKRLQRTNDELIYKLSQQQKQ